MSILIRAVNLVTKNRLERAGSPHTSNWGLRRIWLRAYDLGHSSRSESTEARNTRIAAEAELARRMKTSKMPEVLLTAMNVFRGPAGTVPRGMYIGALQKLTGEEALDVFDKCSDAWLVLTWRMASVGRRGSPAVNWSLKRGRQATYGNMDSYLREYLRARGIAQPENYGDIVFTMSGWRKK